MIKNQQTGKQHYFENYDHKARWLSYYYQIREIKKGEKVLEIGIGNGTVADYLRKRSSIVTMDIDKELNPDIVGDVLNIPFENKEFDVVLCAEVLEHLPFEYFEKALKEIRRVGKRAIISLPD
ncbi:MAG: class I SAM-dependent methyltransferase, partial [bacterium]|nr:class I SAM-dependent methyltransferase [bacterium]